MQLADLLSDIKAARATADEEEAAPQAMYSSLLAQRLSGAMGELLGDYRRHFGPSSALGLGSLPVAAEVVLSPTRAPSLAPAYAPSDSFSLLPSPSRYP